MPNANRVFSFENPNSGVVEWYFQAREGDFDPYGSSQIAKEKLTAFVEECIKAADSRAYSGRQKKCAA